MLSFRRALRRRGSDPPGGVRLPRRRGRMSMPSTGSRRYRWFRRSIRPWGEIAWADDGGKGTAIVVAAQQSNLAYSVRRARYGARSVSAATIASLVRARWSPGHWRSLPQPYGYRRRLIHKRRQRGQRFLAAHPHPCVPMASTLPKSAAAGPVVHPFARGRHRLCHGGRCARAGDRGGRRDARFQ